MSLAVARTLDHETWTWSDPELGSAGAWLGLGVFSSVVSAGFGFAWLVSRAFPDEGVSLLLLAASVGALIFATASLLLGAVGRVRKRRLAPASVRVDRLGLSWADRRWSWTEVRSVGIGEREIEGGRLAPCVVVRNAAGAEVWLALHQTESDQHALSSHLRTAWTRGAWTSGTPPAPGVGLRLVPIDSADRPDRPTRDT